MLEQRAKLPHIGAIIEQVLHPQEKHMDPEIVSTIQKGLQVINQLYPQEFDKTTVSIGTPKRFPQLEGTVGYMTNFLTRRKRNVAHIFIAGTWDSYQYLIENRPMVIENAQRLLSESGIHDDLKENKSLLVTFFLFHELGHADQLIRELGGNAAEFEKKRDQELQSLPVSGMSPSDILSIYENGKNNAHVAFTEVYEEERHTISK